MHFKNASKFLQTNFSFVSTFILFHYAILKRSISNNYGSKYPAIIEIATCTATPILLLVSLIIISVFGIYKYIIYLYLWLRFGKHFHGLITGMDLLTIVCPGSEGSIQGFIEFSTENSSTGRDLYKQFCTQIYKKFYLTKVNRKFFSTREYSKFGYHYFLEHFGVDVEDIVKFIQSPYCNENDTIEQDELLRLAQQYYNSPLPVNNKFNWDICVCLNPIRKTDKTEFVLFTRMHHTLGDGLVIYNILINNIFQMGTEFKIYAENLVNKCKKLEKKSTSNYVYKFGIKPPFEKPCILRDGKQHVRSIYTRRIEPPSQMSLLDKMKIIRKKFPGVFTLCIFMTAYSASLAEYYLRHSKKNKDIPESIQSSYPVQLNFKRFLDICASTGEIKLSNEVTGYNACAPIIPHNKHGVPIEDYLIERMLQIKDDLSKTFNSMDAQANYIWSKFYYGVLPYQIISKLFEDIFFQTLTSFLPGGPKLKLFNNDNISNITYFLPRQTYTCLFLAINTYDNRLQVGITADEDKVKTLKNLNEICDGIFKYLEILYEQCLKYESVTI